MLAKLPYSEQYRFGASPGASSFIFNINNPNDPWAGLGNPAATNMSLLGSYYKWCTVYGVKVSATYYQRSVTGLDQQGCIMFFIPYNAYTGAPTVDDDLYTTRWVSWKTVGTVSTKVYHHKRYYDFNKLTGNHAVDKDPTSYSVDCANGSAPSILWQMLIQQYPIRSTDNVIEMDARIRITFYCKFWQIRDTWSA